jgi:hypothetical protein
MNGLLFFYVQLRSVSGSAKVFSVFYEAVSTAELILAD